MKKFDTVEDVAMEMGIPAAKLQATFDKYMEICKDPKKDPFGKKFFHNTNWKNNAGPFHVAVMSPVLHYTMGGLEINNRSEVLDTKKQPIPGLFASGEIAGGVHGANRLGGSSLLYVRGSYFPSRAVLTMFRLCAHSGCVVFGRVAGDSAASHLLKELSTGSGALSRLTQVNGHLSAAPLSTTIQIDPSSQQVNLTFKWGSGEGHGSGANAGDVKPQGPSTAEQPANEVSTAAKHNEKTESGEKQMKEYTVEDVSKHKTKDDCWVGFRVASAS